MNQRIHDIMAQMTLDEKAALCSGADFWHLKSFERLGLSSIMVADGPHGLRKQEDRGDHIGMGMSVPATCFPTASATASSWDTDLIYQMGVALGEECLALDVSVLLGPGANIKRSPLCGRNFEYISEDPHLTGHIASAFIEGVQSKGIGTSLKHYAMNNQEARRMTIDTIVDERAQREIYLTGFETAVKNAQPWTVMCSYNRLDGTYLSDHHRLLTQILKDEWGHTGLVVSDWGACNDRAEGIRAGMEIEMPSSNGINDSRIVHAVQTGQLTMEALNRAVERIIRLILLSQDNRQPHYPCDWQAHHQLARDIAAQSAVLLKNDGLLPLSSEMNIAVIGEFAQSPRYQGAGSSLINPYQVDHILSIMDQQGITYRYAPGYRKSSDTPDEALIMEAVSIAQEADAVILVSGLTDDYESEGFDRTHLHLPDSHNQLIQAVAKVNPHTVVVLQNGAPVTLPWIKDVPSILECYLSGQAGAGAAVDILFGKVNPSGKLAETFPFALSDTPCHTSFPGGSRSVEYRESIYVGYRYYDTAHKDVLFPFGHGLSYTQFTYDDQKITRQSNGTVHVECTVRNTGSYPGQEIIQLYVQNNPSTIFKADKELRAFTKVHLDCGESKTVSFTLDQRAFSYYNTDAACWHMESGQYGILIGASSRDIRLQQTILIEGDSSIDVPDYRQTLSAYYQLGKTPFHIPRDQFQVLYGKALPQADRTPGTPFDINSSLEDIQEKWIGRQINKIVVKMAMASFSAHSNEGDTKKNAPMMEAMVREMPLRSLEMMGGAQVPRNISQALVDVLNGHPLRGIGHLLRR